MKKIKSFLVLLAAFLALGAGKAQITPEIWREKLTQIIKAFFYTSQGKFFLFLGSLMIIIFIIIIVVIEINIRKFKKEPQKSG